MVTYLLNIQDQEVHVGKRAKCFYLEYLLLWVADYVATKWTVTLLAEKNWMHITVHKSYFCKADANLHVVPPKWTFSEVHVKKRADMFQCHW